MTRAEREGLVTRRPGEDRPRTVLVELTPAGHEKVEATVGQVLHREAELTDGLTPAQQKQLAGLLRILLQDTQRKLGDDRISQVGEG